MENESVTINKSEPSLQAETREGEEAVAISPQQQKLTRSSQSALGLYRELAVGQVCRVFPVLDCEAFFILDCSSVAGSALLLNGVYR
jgi:hypothetical protein